MNATKTMSGLIRLSGHELHYQRRDPYTSVYGGACQCGRWADPWDNRKSDVRARHQAHVRDVVKQAKAAA
jgi:hypothetical protein